MLNLHCFPCVGTNQIPRSTSSGCGHQGSIGFSARAPFSPTHRSSVRRGVVCSIRETTKSLKTSSQKTEQLSRRVLLGAMVVAPWLTTQSGASASAEAKSKLLNLSPDEIKAIVKEDLVTRQFLATANFTQEIYADDCIFQDEINSYSLTEFVKGTSKLFDASRSQVDLVGDVEADENKITFRFSEELCFNVPFKPKTYLSGKLELTRNEDGLISKYKETWDQPVTRVLSTVHF